MSAADPDLYKLHLGQPRVGLKFQVPSGFVEDNDEDVEVDIMETFVSKVGDLTMMGCHTTDQNSYLRRVDVGEGGVVEEKNLEVLLKVEMEHWVDLFGDEEWEESEEDGDNEDWEDEEE